MFSAVPMPNGISKPTLMIGVSTLNDQPMQAADFSRLGDFLGPMIAGLQTGHVSLIKGRVS
jgi:predicted lipid-binding transport protein (Tim44 family)